MENKIDLSLKDINICFNIKSNIIYADIIDNNLSKIALRFNNLDDAFIFMKTTINKCNTLDEAIEIYDSLNKEIINNNKIILTKDEVISALMEYYRTNKYYRVTINENSDGFYLSVFFQVNGLDKEVRVLLTNDDIRKALDNYISTHDYELLDFKYINNEDSICDGVEIKVKDKTLIKSLE